MIYTQLSEKMERPVCVKTQYQYLKRMIMIAWIKKQLAKRMNQKPSYNKTSRPLRKSQNPSLKDIQKPQKKLQNYTAVASKDEIQPRSRLQTDLPKKKLEKD